MAFVALTGVAPDIVQAATDAELSPVVLMAVIAAIHLLLGMFLDPIGIMVLMMPLIETYGFDPIWFAVVVTKPLESGPIAPPATATGSAGS